MSESNDNLPSLESEYSNGRADGSYEAAHGDRPLTDTQLAELSWPYAKGYCEGYYGREELETELGQ